MASRDLLNHIRSVLQSASIEPDARGSRLGPVHQTLWKRIDRKPLGIGAGRPIGIGEEIAGRERIEGSRPGGKSGTPGSETIREMSPHEMDAAFSIVMLLVLLAAVCVGYPLFTAVEDWWTERRFHSEHEARLRDRWQ
mgnify:CR=1 FL=1